MSSTAAILGLAGQNLAQGRASDALRLLDQALIDHGNERALHALRAQALYALGDQRGAAGAMAALVILGPADAESLLALGLLLDPLHADHSAALCCKRARLARPGFSRPALAEALIRLRAKDFAEAFDLIKAGGIGTTTPERIRLETRIGDSLREAMAEHAGEMEMLAAWPGCANSPLILQALAECALAKLNFDTAIRALKRLAQLRPDWPYLTGQQAFLDFRTGNWSDVLRLLGTAPNAGETAPGLSLLRALAQARNGDEVSARRQLIQMVDTVGIEENDYRCARLFLARADLASGDSEAADRISAELTADGAGAKAFIQAMSVMRQLDHPGYNRLAHKIGLHHAVTGYIAARGHGAFVYYPES